MSMWHLSLEKAVSQSTSWITHWNGMEKEFDASKAENIAQWELSRTDYPNSWWVVGG